MKTKNYKILVGAAVFNEAETLPLLLSRFKRLLKDTQYTLMLVNDGSSDDSELLISQFAAKQKNSVILTQPVQKGVGVALQEIYRYGLKQKFDMCVIMAGNGKDDPGEVPLLTAELITKKADYIQGSRFLEGGSFNNLPWTRMVMVKMFTWFIYIVATNGRVFGTDATNGFRAYRFKILLDPRIDVFQTWLGRYELEIYLHYKVLSLGYKFAEIAVHKDYPKKTNFSKIKPVIDWWKIIKPVVWLKLRIKH